MNPRAVRHPTTRVHRPSYVLGTLRGPAQADDSGRIVELLREIARAESGQADALNAISRSAERCAK